MKSPPSRFGLWVSVACALLAFAATRTIAGDAESVAATATAFHDALRRGDEKAAMQLLSSDAMILEAGVAQTREEYGRHHLQEDIAFSRDVKTSRSVVSTQIEGNVAWIVSTMRSEGAFQGRKIDSTGVELIVLTRIEDEWRIRAIHWSSQSNKPSTPAK